MNLEQNILGSCEKAFSLVLNVSKDAAGMLRVVALVGIVI